MPSPLTLCNTQKCLQDLDSFSVKHLLCAQYLPQWSTVLEIRISVQRFPVCGHRSSWFFSVSPSWAFPGHWSKMEKQGEDNGGIWKAWDLGVFYFHIYTSPSFTKDLSWLFGTTKKKKDKVAEENFSFAISKARTIKWMLTSDEALSSPRAGPWLCGLAVGPGRALLSEGTTCGSAVRCHRCVTTARPCPPEKCWWYSHLAGLSLCVKVLASMYKMS